MNDPIKDMTKDQVDDACLEILGLVHDATNVSDRFLIGAIILKLKEWKCDFSWLPVNGMWVVDVPTREGDKKIDESLQVAFLRTAQALGHWSPPKKVEPEETHWLNPETNSVITILPKDGIILSDSWVRVRLTPFEK